MNDRAKEFLAQLLSALNQGVEPDVLREIHKDVDIGLVNALGDWLQSQCDAAGQLKMGKVLSSIAYHIALVIAKESENEEHACVLSQAYADYLHQITHAIYDGKRGTSKKSS